MALQFTAGRLIGTNIGLYNVSYWQSFKNDYFTLQTIESKDWDGKNRVLYFGFEFLGSDSAKFNKYLEKVTN